MKLIYTLFFLLLFSIVINAQDSLSFNKKYVYRNNISAELAGIGGLYSINYERNFGIKNNSFHNIRAGFSYDGGAFYNNSINLPVAYTYNLGKKKSKIFMGMGFTFLIATQPDDPETIRKAKQNTQTIGRPITPPLNFWLSPTIGYELISKKIFYFKAYASVMVGKVNFIYYYAAPWGGFIFGFKLKK